MTKITRMDNTNIAEDVHLVGILTTLVVEM